jgi:hypothetical protein
MASVTRAKAPGALLPVGEAESALVRVNPVGDYPGADPTVGEQRPDGTRRAVLEQTHCVVEVGPHREGRRR